MKKLNFNLEPMSEKEYTDAIIAEGLRSLVTEYRQGVSPKRICELVNRLGIIKKRGLKATNEEQSN